MESNVGRTVGPDEEPELLAAAKPFEADDAPYEPPDPPSQQARAIADRPSGHIASISIPRHIASISIPRPGTARRADHYSRAE
jgi:hypothetical protein